MREVGERMKGGAVREERSPENEAMLTSDYQIFEQLKKEEGQYDLRKRGPTSSLSGRYGLHKFEQQKIARKVQTHTSFFGSHRAPPAPPRLHPIRRD